MLPEGTAPVLEGGGLRGFHGSGVMEVFMKRIIMFPYIVGVSAGAVNALSYISGQSMGSRQTAENYVAEPGCISWRSLLSGGPLFDFDHIFETILQELVFFDRDACRNQETNFLTGAMNCADGKTIWFNKEQITPLLTVPRASCSIPFLAGVQPFMGHDLVDGGISDGIPIEKSVGDGNRFHVIVLTRNAGYRKKPFRHAGLLRLLFRKYPAWRRRCMTAIRRITGSWSSAKSSPGRGAGRHVLKSP